jgi:hypothetical protein
VGDHGHQRRREALQLGLPVREQRRRHDQEMRRVVALALPLVPEQEPEHLNGLAESHVVGQAHAEPERRGEAQPRHADLLVRPQRAAQIGAGIGVGQLDGAAQCGQCLGEPRAGFDA